MSWQTVAVVGPVAQWTERRLPRPTADGSTPSGLTWLPPGAMRGDRFLQPEEAPVPAAMSRALQLSPEGAPPTDQGGIIGLRAVALP